MNATRVSRSVLTCDRDMPAGQAMCAHCWSKVPKDLRRQLDVAPRGTRRTQLERQAVAAAQAVTS